MPGKGSANLSNRPFDVVIAVLGVLGLVLFLAFYDRAFPSAALELELSREQIADRAVGYLQALGYDLSAYQFALAFHEAWMPSVYLQQTMGIPETNELARQQELPLWLWEARWFRPLQKEEFYLSLMPDGTVVAMTHSVLEDAPGADIAQEQARAIAEAYLVRDRGWDLADWESVTMSTEAQPGGRSDHHFAWKRLDWDVGESELRLAVDVQGDAIGGYGYWLKVPESFLRRFSEQRNRAGFINGLAYYLGVGGCGVVALLYYVLGHRRGLFSWRAGLVAGLLVGGVELLAELNYLPLRKAWYGTTQEYGVFWIDQLIDIAISATFVAGAVVVLWAGGRYLARKVWTRHDKVLARGDDRWGALSRATWRGLMLGGLHAGYAVAFYWLATQVLGGWTPMGAPDVNLYATPLPFLAPLATGIIPAISEEFLFRLVGIGILLAVTQKRWLAACIPGVLWAFAHLAYVRDPIYLRGIELTLVALAYAWVLLRFDLATTIVAHLSYNVWVTVLPLLRAQHPYFVANGALVLVGLVVPLVPGAIRALRRRLRGAAALAPPIVRPATAGDAPGLSALCGGVDWEAWLGDPSATVFCLCAQDQVIGLAAGHLLPDDVGQVSLLFVAPEWRRHYWGSQLAQTLGEALWERGARTLQVTVPAEDWRLARFWDAQGWERSATVYARGELTLSLRKG